MRFHLKLIKLNNQLFTIASNIKPLLDSLKKICIVTHYNPDGDAMGSSLGLYWFLKENGHQVQVVIPNDFPEFLKWMKGSEEVIVHHHKPELVAQKISEADIIFCADFNNLTRLKGLGPIIQSAQAIKILIDHHPYPEHVFNYQYSNIKASSTCELMYQFITSIDIPDSISHQTAECLYTGIMTDTGCFSHAASSETFRVVAALIDRGIDRDKIFEHIYNNFSVQRMKLMGYCLNEKMVVLPEFRTAYIWLTKQELEKFGFQTGDTEGFVNIPFSIKGINIAALFTEKDNLIRISLRSKGLFAVNEISEKNFEGGGHKNAAGGESKLTMTETISKFENILKNHKTQIDEAYTGIE